MVQQGGDTLFASRAWTRILASGLANERNPTDCLFSDFQSPDGPECCSVPACIGFDVSLASFEEYSDAYGHMPLPVLVRLRTTFDRPT